MIYHASDDPALLEFTICFVDWLVFGWWRLEQLWLLEPMED